MDAFDQKILALLQRNARQSVSSIAEQVHLSRSAVSERIKRMEESGEIQGYAVLTRPQQTLGVKAFFSVAHQGFHCAAIAEQASTIEGVTHCYGLSGDMDMLILAETSSIAAMEQVRYHLAHIPNIGKITTHFIMKQWDKG